MCGKYSLPEFANFLIVLRAEIATTFGSKMVTISARDTIIRKFANFARLYFPYFTTLRHQILEFYYFLKKVLSRNFFFVWICLYQKLVYHANCQFFVLTANGQYAPQNAL